MTSGRLRSLLFAPGSRPDLMEKLPRAEPDAVALDLEDSVAPASKDEARAHVRSAAIALAASGDSPAVYVRVNAVASEWIDDDLDGIPSGVAGVIVPKLEAADQVAHVVAQVESRGLGHLEVLAGIETVAGVAYAHEILSVPGVGNCYFGAEDYIADLGGVRTPGNEEVLYARSKVAIAARLAGVGALDQIVPDLTDEDRFRRDAAQGRALGYRGKLCIHPAQVRWANESFTPSDEEVTRAARLLTAYEAALERGQSSAQFEGQMIDEPLARQARAIVADRSPDSAN